MNEISFEWDDGKELSNIKKHGVSFTEAKEVFYDFYARLIPDPARTKEEERFIMLGMNQSLKLLVVCHCYRQNDSVIRIISARKATRKEQTSYRENLP